jgi:hypothetical protein
MRKLLSAFLFASAVSSAACSPPPKRSTFVKVDQVALGKVVVYRNGVAFYQRRAQVEGGKLTVSVPRDRVDDFLKSLTVVDAKTQSRCRSASRASRPRRAVPRDDPRRPDRHPARARPPTCS